MAASRTALITSKDTSPSENESLTALVSRLGEDVMQLFDTKLSLLKVEIKEEANAYARGGIAISLGGIVAAVGFAFVNIAVVFGVSTLFANTSLSQPAKYGIGFVVTGLFYLIVGGIVIMAAKNRLANHELVPTRTVEELRKDKQWVKNEL